LLANASGLSRLFGRWQRDIRSRLLQELADPACTGLLSDLVDVVLQYDDGSGPSFQPEPEPDEEFQEISPFDQIPRFQMSRTLNWIRLWSSDQVGDLWREKLQLQAAQCCSSTFTLYAFAND
jgi:hypothetical protein